MRSKKHIDDRTLVRLVRGEIGGKEYEQLMEHIIQCDDCRFKYVSLRKYVASRKKPFALPETVARFAYLLSGFLLFVLMSFFSHRVDAGYSYEIPARYASDTGSVSVEVAPRIKYIYIDTLALHVFYLRGESTLFKFDFEPHGNVLKIKAKKPAP